MFSLISMLLSILSPQISFSTLLYHPLVLHLFYSKIYLVGKYFLRKPSMIVKVVSSKPNVINNGFSAQFSDNGRSGCVDAWICGPGRGAWWRVVLTLCDFMGDRRNCSRYVVIHPVPVNKLIVKLHIYNSVMSNNAFLRPCANNNTRRKTQRKRRKRRENAKKTQRKRRENEHTKQGNNNIQPALQTINKSN